MKNILIIGSEGFIGSNLAKYYINKGWETYGIDRLDNPSQKYTYFKLLTLTELTELMLKSSFSYIINAAGSGNVNYSMTHPLGDFESNCFETAKILDSIRVAGNKTSYIHISSAAVYGNPASIPVTEAEAVKPLSPYGWHKLVSEMICKEYSDVYGIRTSIVRPFSVYGPGLRKQLFWDIYQKAFASPSVELFGTGNESRDFIFIDDLVKGIDIILEKGETNASVYNLATGIETSIKDAASLFLKFFPSKPQPLFNGHVKDGDPLNWKADISKISAIGFNSSLSITQGLELTFKWIHGHSK